jgi:hypothetical protein
VPQIISMPYFDGVHAVEVLARAGSSTEVQRHDLKVREVKTLLIEMSTDPIEAPCIGAVMGRWP